MRKKLLLAIAFSLGIWAYVLMLAATPKGGSPAAAAIGAEDGITALFSPSGDCTKAMIDEINKATQSLDIAAYTLTAPEIAQAITSAKARNVKIRVIVDKRQRTDRASQITYLASHQVPVLIDDHHAIFHDKFMLIDGKVLITGSFNFTKDSEDHNAENVLIIRDRPKLIKSYQDNFEHHVDHSIPFAVPAKQIAAP